MIISILIRTFSLLYYPIVLASLFFSFNTYAGNSNQNFKHDSDSIKVLLEKCNTDTCEYRILSGLFWKYLNTDFKHAKFIGNWAFEVIKNSRNLQVLSDGYDIKGRILVEEQKFDSAKHYYEQALKLSLAINYRFRICWSYFHIGRLDYHLGNFNTALGNMKKAEKYLTAKNDSAIIFRFMTLIYERLNNTDSAYISFNKLFESYNNKNDRGQELPDYFEVTNFALRRNDAKKSLEYFSLLLKLAESIKNERALVNVYIGIGDFFASQKKNYHVALDYYNKALEKWNDNKYDYLKAYIYNKLGNIYLALDKDSTALFYNLIGLEIAENLNHRRALAEIYESLGYTYKKLKNAELALYNFKKCFEIGSSVRGEIFYHESLIEIADLYLQLNSPKEALRFYLKAFELAIRFHAKEEMIVSNLKIGNYYIAANPKLAEKYYSSSLEIAVETKEIALIKTLADTLNHYYLYKNNYKSAYHYQHLASVMGDSLSKMDRLTNTAELEMKFVVEKLQKDNEAKQALSALEIKRQKVYRNSLFLISGLLGMLGLVVFNSYKRKKKDNLQLAISKKEIETQKNRIEEISKKLHETDQAKLRFFTNISHEFRTPLTLILGPIEKLIKDHAHNQDTGLFLKIIQRNTYQLFNLINQLLDIRKLDTGNVKLQVSKGDITGFCKGICATFSHLAEENKITYTFTKTDNMIGWFDRDIIEKVMNNLLSNAFKYTPQGGKIRVTIGEVDQLENELSHIKITVKDNGKGIPADQLKYVFNRYYQVEKYNNGFNTGTGIGLAYAKEIIELHKGKVNVQSNINRGTTFTIILPVHQSHYSKKEIAITDQPVKETEKININPDYLQQITNPEPNNDPTKNKKYTVEDEQVMLIIEDNPDVRIFIKSIFDKDFSIFEASDGLTGYQLAYKLIPDIIISDIMMPEMDGLELCKKLKSDIHTNHIPILILTARAGDENEIEGLKTGADDYLTKPFNTEILEARVNGLISLKKKLREHFARQFILNPKEVKLVSPEDEFLKKVITLVEDNITNPELDVEFLIQELGVSRPQLFRKLKATTNYSANQFIRNIRLRRAAQILLQKSLNISEVMYLSGFNSPSYFTACFKEMFGCSPKEYVLKEEVKTQNN